ncbi:MAG: hypothetical protein K8L99_23010, partial [Anaerolineae bacterium]|nr:hypothetical protein [Anaerolineae bacterium]
IGIVDAIYRRRRGSLLALTYALIFLAFIVLVGIRWERWLVPAVPFAALLVGGAVTAFARLIQGWPRPAEVLAVAVLVALVALPLARLSWLAGWMLTRPETRTLAREWIDEHIPAGSRILVERHGPQPPKTRYSYYEAKPDGSIEAVDVAQRPFLNLYGYGQIGWIKDLNLIHQQDIQYLLMSDYYQQYQNEARLYPAMVKKYEQLRAMGEIIYEIGPQPGEYPGPAVTIVRINPS